MDSTPALGTVINGDFVPHYATYIHDRLHAKALVLKTQTTTLAIVVVDICVMGQELLDQAKGMIQEHLGIPTAHVTISSTHTHAAGAVEEVHFVQADLAYRNQLPNYILDAVSEALKQMQPARIGFGSVLAPEHLRCRRYAMHPDYTPLNPVTGMPDQIKTNPFGVEDQIIAPIAVPDPELAFMAVMGLSGEWISVLGNYSLHYVGDWENGTISADYFGVFANALKKGLEANDRFVGIMSNGTSGDINIWDFLDAMVYPSERFAKSKLIGEDLAARLVEAIPGLEWDDAPDLKVISKELRVPRRMPDAEDLRKAAEILSEGGLEHLVPDAAGWRKLYAREQLLLASYPSHASVPIQVLKIGKGKIGALPGEIFASTGLKIKKEASGPYFTIGLANGNVGYIPPAHELETGGYETWRCRISNLYAKAEEDIRTELVGLIHTINPLS